MNNINNLLDNYNKQYSNIILENNNILNSLESILSIDKLKKDNYNDKINNFNTTENIENTTTNIIDIILSISKQLNYISTFANDIKLIDIYNEKYNYSIAKKTEVDKEKNIYIQKSEQFINWANANLNLIFDEFIKLFDNLDIDYIDYLSYLSNQFETNHDIIDFYVYVFNFILDNKEINIDKIKIIIDKNKNNVLKIKNVLDSIVYSLPFDYTNILQTFNLIKYIPDNNKIYNISKKLFNYESKLFQHLKNNKTKMTDKIIKDIINELSIIASANQCGIIIMYKTGNNIYYNIQKLLINNDLPTNDYKVNEQYINLYKILVDDNQEHSIKDETVLIPININKDTQKVIMLETTNMDSYRLYSNKPYIDDNDSINKYYISMNIINNIIRNKPSERINKINNIMSNVILDNINPDLKNAYNDIVNLDFDTMYDSKMYIKLSDLLFTNIIKLFNNKSDTITKKEFINFFTNDEFTKIINQTIADFYFQYIENHIKNKYTEELATTYFSELDNLSRKITKDFIDYIPNLDNNNINYKEIISSILNILINENMNIYDTIIEKNYILQSFA